VTASADQQRATYGSSAPSWAFRPHALLNGWAFLAAVLGLCAVVLSVPRGVLTPAGSLVVVAAALASCHLGWRRAVDTPWRGGRRLVLAGLVATAIATVEILAGVAL
jgi:hypothetical protein